MSEAKQLLKRPLPLAGCWRGEVASNPTDMNQKIDVLIPDFSRTKRWRKVRWQARSDTALPSRGDKCVVVFDSRGDAWVIAWWPFFD